MKQYPLIIKMYGDLYRLQHFYGRWSLRKCDKNGKVFPTVKKKCQIIPFKKIDLIP